MQFNEANPLALSCLGHAARMGDEENVLRLLRRGRRVDVADNRGWNSIHEAVAGNHVGCLKMLLQKGRSYVNYRTMEGETPLLLACMHQNNPELLQLLFKYGADVNLGNNEYFTPLHQACKSGKRELVEALVGAGAKLDALNYNDCTPLHLTVSANNAELVKYLISKGADLSLKDECGRTPLFLASELGCWDVVEPIINTYPNVNTRAADGATALMLACQYGHLKVVEELLKKGADPNLASDDGTMAIHLAVHNGHLSVVQLLLTITSKEAILKNHSSETYGITCLAIDGGCLEVLNLLLKSDLGNEVLHIAVKNDVGQYEGNCKKHLMSGPVSFVLSTQFEKPEDVVTYLELLIKHNFPVNITTENELPPLVALCMQYLPDDIMLHCMDLLLSCSADVDYNTTQYNIPDALWAAAIDGRSSAVLKLLRAGSSGSLEDLLLLLKIRFDNGVIPASIIDLVKFVVGLGISKPELNREVQRWFYKNSIDGAKDVLTFLAEHEICSLQQLCRTAVRKYLKKPISKSLSVLPVPVCIKEYVTYTIL